MLGASMLTLGSCTDLSETIYSEIASEQYEFSESDNQGQFATVYSSLRDFYWAWYGYADLDICTDLWCIPLRLGVGCLLVGGIQQIAEKHRLRIQVRSGQKLLWQRAEY